ncbi:MAG: hypothetical protein QM820_16190 [Minicystis sp.]
MSRRTGMSVTLGLSLLVNACGGQAPAQPESEPPLQAGCNPLGGAADEDCFLPFPSSHFTVSDASTATGLRVDLPEALLPASVADVRFDPAPLNRRDGFSPATTLLTYFPTRVDSADLPGPDHIEKSVLPESTVQLLRFDTGERVPLFAEVDANAFPMQKQALILRPVVRLAPATRYVAVIQHLHRADGGGELAPLSGFRAFRDDITAEGSPRRAEREHYEEIFTALEKQGIARATLQLAWDFTTGSDEPIHGRLVRMRDQAMSYVGSVSPPPFTFTKVDESPADLPGLQRRILGTFTVPSFLTNDASGGLSLGADGEPQIRDHGQFPLAIHVPECALTTTTPLPVMIFGHGSYSSAAEEMATDYQREITNRLCMIEVGTDWTGRASPDALFFLNNVLTDVNQLHISTERLQQAQINVLMLARLLKSGTLAAAPELQLNGKPLMDPSRVYYYGISEGGIQGGTFLALTSDVDRGALNVPCGFWSMFFWRSSDFYTVSSLFRQNYPDPLGAQVLMALTQPLWDYTDPATYGPHLIHDPLSGSMPKKILYQEGINDGSVPNQNTRAMVRTMGLTLLDPPVEAVFGVEQSKSPQESAYAQFDVGAMPRIGGDNVPPPDSPVHETIRNLEEVKKQLELFLREGGKVEDTCGGKPCVGLKP